MFGNGEYKRFLSMPNRRYDYCIVTNFFEIIKVLEIIYYGFLKHDPVRQIVEVGIYYLLPGLWVGETSSLRSSLWLSLF